MASQNTPVDRSEKIRERILQLMVDSALEGHELSAFGDIGFGVQAVCQRCDRWVQINYAGQIWSRLGGPCQGHY